MLNIREGYVICGGAEAWQVRARKSVIKFVISQWTKRIYKFSSLQHAKAMENLSRKCKECADSGPNQTKLPPHYVR